MAKKQNISEFVRLIRALKKEKIRFQLVGMASAVAQGVPVSTLDTDLWVDLPPRQYLRLYPVIEALDGLMTSRTSAELRDGSKVDFCFWITGLRSFDKEIENTQKIKIEGVSFPALKLERILKSKLALKRPKDKMHIIYIKQFLKVREKLLLGTSKARSGKWA